MCGSAANDVCAENFVVMNIPCGMCCSSSVIFVLSNAKKKSIFVVVVAVVFCELQTYLSLF